MSEEAIIRLCAIHAKTCVLDLRKVPNSLEDAKCFTCKKKRPTYAYEIRTKGDRWRR